MFPRRPRAPPARAKAMPPEPCPPSLNTAHLAKKETAEASAAPLAETPKRDSEKTRPREHAHSPQPHNHMPRRSLAQRKTAPPTSRPKADVLCAPGPEGKN